MTTTDPRAEPSATTSPPEQGSAAGAHATAPEQGSAAGAHATPPEQASAAGDATAPQADDASDAGSPRPHDERSRLGLDDSSGRGRATSATPADGKEADATTHDGPAAAGTRGAVATEADDTAAHKGGRRASKEGNGRSRVATAAHAVKAGTDAVRNRIASAVWLVAVACAMVLAAGALLVALEANRSNDIVQWVLDAAGSLDGPFWKVFEFEGPDAAVKEHLVNWGLAAVAYLVAGRILDRIIRP
jgi:hypothetical protein